MQATSKPIGISKTDLQKITSYLDDAAKLYEALPMQKCRCRAHMIRQLLAKLDKSYVR